MNNIDDIIALNFDCIDGRIAKSEAFAREAKAYSQKFEAAWERRQERMAEDSKQFREVIIPRIKAEASLRAYERGLA